MMRKREFRKSSGEIRVETVNGSKKIVGYAAVFNQLSEPLNIRGKMMRERVMPGAFTKCLEGSPDIRGLVNHNADLVLGRTASGTMRVSEDEHGLRYEIDPPDTSYARDLMVSLERGDINQSSFGFYTVADDYVNEEGSSIRELHEVDCFDCSCVTYPAYTGSSSGVRATEELRAMFPDGLPESLESETKMPNKENRENEQGCDCECDACMASNCEECSFSGCDDPECAADGCPMQERSGKKDGEQRDDAKTKNVGGQDLHASDFAHVGDPNDTSTWKLPIHDASHVRNALARFNQVQGLSKEEKDAAWKKILAAAKKFGIQVSESNASKLLDTASYRDAKALVRMIDPDGDGDDDEPLIDALLDARDACGTVAGTASGALWTFWDGDTDFSDPMFEAFVKQASVLIDRLQAAISEVNKELSEPAEGGTEDTSGRSIIPMSSFDRIKRMAELEKD